jgi:hypothetical protein
MPSNTVHEALTHFYKITYLEPNFKNRKLLVKAKVGKLPIYMPNFSLLKNIYLHDINHMITKYPLTWKGEFELSAWEVAAGGWEKNYIAWYLCLMGLAFGTFTFPKAIWVAYKRGMRQTNACFLVSNQEETQHTLLEVLEKRMLENKELTKSEIRIFLSFIFWCLASSIIFWGPFVLILRGFI